MHDHDVSEKGLAELIVLKKRQLGDDVGSVRRLVWVGVSYRDYPTGPEPSGLVSTGAGMSSSLPGRRGRCCGPRPLQ